MNKPSFFLFLAGVFGGLAVVLGAFAAHGLRDKLEPRMLEVFETGARYQIYHAIALLAVSYHGLVAQFNSWTLSACWAWTVGILIFSGSLYLLILTGIKWFGAITPIGGTALIIGWISLAISALGQRAS